MSRVLALVEGYTEKKFVYEILGPALSYQGVYLEATLLGRSVHQGGVGSYQRFRREMMAVVRQGGFHAFSMMFDFYGLPNDWPGMKTTSSLSVENISGAIESAVSDDLTQEFQKNSIFVRFIPYIQMYEFEALLFSAPETLAKTVGNPKLTEEFQKIVQSCGGPEKINDSPNTAPSKRIESFAPNYQKTVTGIIAAKRMGLGVMREECSHFNAWVERLEALGNKYHYGSQRRKHSELDRG